MISSARHTIAKNASVLMVAQLITWGLALLLSIFMPRYLGAEALGKYQVASSLWLIMFVLVTFGMDTLLTKEISRSPERLSELLMTSILLRVALYVLGFIAMITYGHMVGYSEETILILYIVGTANFFVILSSAYQAALQGLERMEHVSIGDILSKTFSTILIIALLLIGYRLIAVTLVFVGGAFISFIYKVIALQKLHPITFKVNFSLVGWMAGRSFPYLMINGIRTVYSQLDVVIISLLVTETVVGYYSTANTLFATLLFIPTVFNAAVFPAMSRMFTSSPDSLLRLFRKNFDLLLLFGVPIGLGTFLIADNLVVRLFGPEFVKSGPVLALMGIVLIITYQNSILGQYLISIDRQNFLPWVIGAAMLATIPLDVFLIPWCQENFQNGAIGGGLSYLITETGILVADLFILPRGTLGRTNFSVAGRIFLAGGLMLASTWWLRDQFLLIPILAGAVIYVVAILLLKVIPQEDWDLLKSMVESLIGFLRRRKSQPSSIGE